MLLEQRFFSPIFEPVAFWGKRYRLGFTGTILWLFYAPLLPKLDTDCAATAAVLALGVFNVVVELDWRAVLRYDLFIWLLTVAVLRFE